MNTTPRFRFFSAALILCLCIAVGCNPPTPKKKVAKEDRPAGGIIGQETTEVGEWDPDAGMEVVVENDGDVNIINRNMKAFGRTSDTIAKLKVKAALERYRALEGDYPKTYEEFKNKFFKNWVEKLPMPRTNSVYQYDVENHELLIVRKKKE